MEHRHLHHHSIRRGKIHSVADRLAVVDDVVVGQHNAFGKARGARRVLHVANVVLIHSRRHGKNGFPLYFLPFADSSCSPILEKAWL